MMLKPRRAKQFESDKKDVLPVMSGVKSLQGLKSASRTAAKSPELSPSPPQIIHPYMSDRPPRLSSILFPFLVEFQLHRCRRLTALVPLLHLPLLLPLPLLILHPSPSPSSTPFCWAHPPPLHFLSISPPSFSSFFHILLVSRSLPILISCSAGVT